MNSNQHISNIIKYIYSLKPSIRHIKNHIVFSSKDDCRNKVLILGNVSNKKKYTYVNEAIKKGILGVVSANTLNENKLFKKNMIYESKYIKNNMNYLLDFIYDYPLQGKKIIGITGTNGKTTLCHLLATCLKKINYKVGLISSEGVGIYPCYSSTGYTTPTIDILYKYFDKFNIAGVNQIIIECSSQGLAQGRLNGIVFNQSILTNINKEHIEYHGSFHKYIMAKSILIKNTSGNVFINSDCNNSSMLSKIIKKKSYIPYKINNIDKNLNKKLNLHDNHDLVFVTNICILSKFLGHNGHSFKKIISILSKIKPCIPGRKTLIFDKKRGIKYLVDYAHTPDALKNLLIYVNNKYTTARIITLFGCGGNRDKHKRKKMGDIAEQYSDILIITDDNPRNEDPNDIINGICKGIKDKSKIYLIPNRKKAIDRAISLSQKKDIIILAGKGNEFEIQYKNRVLKHNDINYLKNKVNEY